MLTEVDFDPLPLLMFLLILLFSSVFEKKYYFCAKRDIFVQINIISAKTVT